MMQLSKNCGFPWKIVGLSNLPKDHLPDEIWSYIAFSQSPWCNIRVKLLDWLSEAPRTTLHPSIIAPPQCVNAAFLPVAHGGIMLHSQTTSAKSDQSSVQMQSRCVPDSTRRKKSFMLRCLSIFQKKKQDWLCLLAMPFKPLTQPRACHCRGHTLPPCCLSLQAKDS